MSVFIYVYLYESMNVKDSINILLSSPNTLSSCR